MKCRKAKKAAATVLENRITRLEMAMGGDSVAENGYPKH